MNQLLSHTCRVQGVYDWSNPAVLVAVCMINSTDISGSDVKVTIRSLKGTLLKCGFAPLEFMLSSTNSNNTNAAYKIAVANHDDCVFQHGDNDGSTFKIRTISNLTEDNTLITAFAQSDSIRGFTSLTYAGATNQPTLGLKAGLLLDQSDLISTIFSLSTPAPPPPFAAVIKKFAISNANCGTPDTPVPCVRAGDYSAVQNDPSTPSTVWVATMYLPSLSWSTYVDQVNASSLR